MAQEHDRQYQPRAEPFTDGPFLPAWQPQAVDQVPRRSVLSAAVLATAIATLVPAPSALEAAARATYPDQISRATLHASQQQALAFAPAPLGDGDLRWAPRYPDRLTRPSLLAPQQQALAFHPEPIAAVTVPEQWTPDYPSKVPGPARLSTAGQQAIAQLIARADQTSAAASDSGVITRPAQVQYQSLVGPVLVPAPVVPAPDLSWSPRYPDQLLPARPVALTQVVAPVAPLGDGDLRWTAQYPVWIDGRPYRVALHQSLAFHPVPLPDAPLPDLAWAPRYPDQLLPAARLLTGRQQVSAQNLDPIADGLPDLAWAPRYPVWIDRRVVHPAHLPWLAAPVAPLVAPLRSWAPTYPDRLVRVALAPRSLSVGPVVALDGGDLRWLSQYPNQHLRRWVHASRQQALAFRVTLEPDPLPDLSWQGEYPEWIARKAYPVAARTFTVDPLSPSAPVTALAWQGQYPDRVPRLIYLAGQQQGLALYPTPITPPTVVELSWLARYPDTVLRPSLLVALQQAFAQNLDPISTSALVPLSWAAQYPDLLLPRGWVRPLGTLWVAPPEMVEVVVQTAPWHPTYPDRIHARTPPPQGPVPVVPIDLVTLANAYTCIALPLDAQQSGLRSWTVRQSSLTGTGIETFTGPGFTVC